MQDKTTLVARCIFSVIILNLLCFFIQMSFNIVAIGAATRPERYDIYINDENGEPQLEYTHYYADGDDERLAEMDEKGIEYSRVDHRTELGKTAMLIVNGLTMVFTVCIFCALIYSTLWKKGDSDNSLSVYSNAPRDKWYGLKVGLLATVPFAAMYLLLVVNKFYTFWPGIYGFFKIANYYLFPLVGWGYGAAESVSQISIAGLLLLLLTLVPIPLAASLGYYCGNNEISIKNKIVYSKEKK